MRPPEFDSLKNLLKQVSRSFYLTLRVLPASIRPQIGLAYLLARATDTIADTRLVSVERRLSALREMRAALFEAAKGRATQVPDFGELAAAQPVPAGQGSPAERILLETAARALDALRVFPLDDRLRIREVLDIITRGQEMDLVRFGDATMERIEALETDAELDEYICCVAGCVGEFWTRMCRTHLFPRASFDDAFFLSSGVRFGKGLQLVNILRDIPRDLRQGRCYLPLVSLSECGLKPHDLLDPASMPRFRPVYDRYVKEAEGHLAQGWAYTKALPYSQLRIRLACAWPALIGAKTISRLSSGNVLDDRERIKVSRAEIRQLMLRTVLRYPVPSSWDRLFDLARN